MNDLRRWSRRILPGLSVGVVLVAVLAAGGVAYVERRHQQAVTLPMPDGSFAVGRMEFDWTDPARLDPLHPEAHSPRELVVWLWYPVDHAASTDATPSAPYVPEPWATLIDQQHGIGALLFQSMRSVRPHALENAPVASRQSTFPVLILLPGFGSIAANYTVLAESLASRGYFVAGLTPTDSSPVVVFADGRVAERTDQGNLPDLADTTTQHRRADDLIAVWSADARFVLDQLSSQNSSASSPIRARLDLDRVGLVGHSFGGATAAEMCRQDGRCKAGVDLDGTLYGPVAAGGLTQPFLFVEHDPAEPCDAQCQEGLHDHERVFQSLDQAYLIRVSGMHHFNFSDNAVLFEPAMSATGQFGPVNGIRGLAITTAYVGTFFDHVLLGKPASLLTGPSTAYPEVQIQSRS